MAGNLNKVALIGNLTRDPELRQIPSGTAVCNMRIAVNDRVKRDGEWTDVPYYFNVTVWAGLAENCARYLSKGKKVGISGKLTWHEWEAQDGSKRQQVEITADHVEFLSPRDGGGSGGAPASDDSSFAPAAAGADDDDIPF